MKAITALIIEDSRLARNEIRELLKPHKHIDILGEARNADEAYRLIGELSPELIFLDINMPGKDGFELLEMLEEVPMVIFTTAYDEYAIKSFEYNALDYLLKPINQDRLANALEKIESRLGQRENRGQEAGKHSEDSQIFIKDGDQCWLVRLGDIELLEVVGNYTRVHFSEAAPLLYKSLNQIEDRLPSSLFFRANRQQIVNMEAITGVVPWFKGKLKLQMQGGAEVEISRRQSSLFRDRMSL